MNKITMVKQVIANFQEYDMSNLFYPEPLLEEMANAAKGVFEAQPQKNLRERQYGNQPLMIKPDYKGDFLERLEQDPIEGKPVGIEAADSENLLDFSMPSEMLKHQEKPHPRILLDDFIEYSRPGDQAGGDDLKEYWKRDWENTDSPEMSEDKWLRMWSRPGEHNYHQARNIVASFISPEDQRVGRVIMGFILGSLSPRTKVARVLGDLRNSRIHGKKILNYGPVTAKKVSGSTAMGRWVFETGEPGTPEKTIRGRTFKKPYKTVIELIPHGRTRNPLLLHANVSCTCPSWLYWGAQYHAAMEGYIYGKVTPVFAPPRKRDPEGGFIACKHILKCIDVMVQGRLFQIEQMPADKRKRMKEIRAPRRLQFETSTYGEDIKVPDDLLRVGKRPKIKKIVELWTEEPEKRRSLVEGLTNEEEITYLAFKYPQSAPLVAERLKNLPNTQAVRESIDKVEELIGDGATVKELAIPAELKKFDLEPSIKGLGQKDDFQKAQIVKDTKDPDLLAYFAYKYHDDGKIMTETDYRLKTLYHKYKESQVPEELEKSQRADYWLRTILGGPAL